MAKSKGFAQAKRNLEKAQDKITKITGTLAGGKKKSYSIPLPKFSFKAGGFKDILSFAKEFPKAFKKSHAKTMELLAEDLKAALDAAMESDTWEWTNDTRDIIDTGALKNSGSVRYVPATETLAISYGEEYAAIVHFGGYVTSGYNPSIQIFYPARPWVTAVIEGGYSVDKFEFEKRYLDYFIDILAKETS